MTQAPNRGEPQRFSGRFGSERDWLNVRRRSGGRRDVVVSVTWTAKHRSRSGDVIVALEGIGGADVGVRSRDALAQALENPHLARAARDEMDRVDSAPLAEAVDAPDPLLEPHRIPRELEVDDDPAGVMQ